MGAALKSVGNLPTGPEAGRNALVNLKPGKIEEAIRRRVSIRTMFATEMILGTSMLMGHPTPYWLAVGGLGLASSMPLFARNVGRWALRDPRIANMVWEGVRNPRAFGAARRAGRVSAEILAAITAQHAREQNGQGQSTEEAPP